MTASFRLATLITSIIAALALSACQQNTQTEDTASPGSDAISAPASDVDTASETQTEADDDAVMDHSQHMTSDEMDAEPSEMLKAYQKSMQRMHDEMMIGMNYNDPDTAFAKGMLGHHRGAVDMAKIELKYGTDETMRKLAEDIIETQRAEIDIMNKWLASHPDTKPKPETLAMQEAYAAGMNTMHEQMMLGIEDPVPDMAFARGMLPHHIGAVDMARVQLQYGTDEEMRELAQDIIDAQQPEIELMQSWIAKHKEDDPDMDDAIDDDAADHDKIGDTSDEAQTKAHNSTLNTAAS